LATTASWHCVKSADVVRILVTLRRKSAGVTACSDGYVPL